MVVSPVPVTSHSLLGEPVFWFSHTTAFAVHPAPCADRRGEDQRAAADRTSSAASADRPRKRFARESNMNGKPFERDTKGFWFPYATVEPPPQGRSVSPRRWCMTP